MKTVARIKDLVNRAAHAVAAATEPEPERRVLALDEIHAVDPSRQEAAVRSAQALVDEWLHERQGTSLNRMDPLGRQSPDTNRQRRIQTLLDSIREANPTHPDVMAALEAEAVEAGMAPGAMTRSLDDVSDRSLEGLGKADRLEVLERMAAEEVLDQREAGDHAGRPTTTIIQKREQLEQVFGHEALDETSWGSPLKPFEGRGIAKWNNKQQQGRWDNEGPHENNDQEKTP